MSDCKYKDALLKNASLLDALSDSKGVVVQECTNVINDTSYPNTSQLLRTLNRLSHRPDSSRIVEVVKVLHDSLLKYLGNLRLREICRLDDEVDVDTRSLQELIADLNKLVGLSGVKDKINSLLAFQQIQIKRKSFGLKCPKQTLHMAFIGNPGTGKTTVARIVGHMYKQIGLLSKGHFMEVSRTDLIAGYQGQTALKVKNLIEKAKGGVLFIDEAYSITENDKSDSYGRECLTELTKALEDYRSDLVVIVAGYKDLMNGFFKSNPGLRSRFNSFIEFDNYSVDELIEIFKCICVDNEYVCTPEVIHQIHNLIATELDSNRDSFSNGRYVRNLFDAIILNHAKRLSKCSSLTKKDLEMIISSDIPSEYNCTNANIL